MAKKIKRRKRKTKNSSRSQSPATATEKRPKWVLVLAAVVCVGIAGLFWLKSLSGPEEKSQKTGTYSDSMAGPGGSVLTEKEEIAALKTEEMQLTQQLLRNFPGSDATLAFVGSVYGQHGNNTEAVKLLNKALELNPNRPDVYDALGWVAFTKGAHEEAITHWRRALEIGAKLPDLRSSIAFSLMALGRHTEAIEQLKNNVQIFPKSVYSNFLLGQAYLQQKDYENAKKHYQTAIRLDQNYVNAYYGLFTAYSRLKQQDKAREYMAAFKKLKAEEMKALKARDKLYDDLITMRQTVAGNQILAARIYQAEGRSDKTEELLQKAVTLDPENPTCLMELADFYSATNRPAEVLKMYKRISEIEPQNPACFLNIGVIAATLKRFDDAEEAFREVIKLAPEDSSGYRELAWLYLNTKNSYDQARKLAEKAVKLEKTAANYYLLTCACEMNGDRTNALKAAEQAIQLDPGNVEYKQTYQRIKNRK
ncbi:MAG: tetratricopeptide repeat protein [Planctomycetota bacterium]|jgi:tetratricopeptide (TPR) repeat protein